MTSQSKLSPTEAKLLARLVGKHGREEIAALAMTITKPRSVGRPNAGDQPLYDLMQFTDMIEDWTEEHRRAGSPKPFVDAATSLYELLYDGEPDAPKLVSFIDTVKRKRQRGRVLWEDRARQVRAYPKEAKALGYHNLPRWLGRKKSAS